MIRKALNAEVLKETALIAAYAAECSLPEIGPVSPQGEMYAAMERSGVNQWFVAEVGGIVGFASVLVCLLPHYGTTVATVESLYGKHGLELMQAVEEYAKECGCVAILYSAPAGGRLEKLLSLKRNYRQSNTVFAKSL